MTSDADRRKVLERPAQQECHCRDGRPPLLVLLPGAGGTASMSFAALLPALTRWTRVLVLALPLPDRGAVDGGDALDHVSDEVASTVRTHRRGERVCVVGHSLGGNIALRAARRHPHLIEDVVIAAMPLDPHPRLRLWRQVWARLLQSDRELAARFLLLSTTDPGRFDGFDDASIEDAVELVEAGLSNDTGRHLDLVSSLAGARQDATALAADGLDVLLGLDDILVPVQPWRDLQRVWPAVRLTVAPGAHDVLTAQPQVSAAYLRDIVLRS